MGFGCCCGDDIRREFLFVAREKAVGGLRECRDTCGGCWGGACHVAFGRRAYGRIGYLVLWGTTRERGGIEDGETTVEAARRELFEETSVKSVQFVTALEEGQRYTFPDFILEKRKKRGIHNPGQDLYWCLFRFTGKDSEINLNTAEPEFRKYEWVTLDEAVKRVVDFKKTAYEKMAAAFSPFIG